MILISFKKMHKNRKPDHSLTWHNDGKLPKTNSAFYCQKLNRTKMNVKISCH